MPKPKPKPVAPKKKESAEAQSGVQTLNEGQAWNPYTELQILSHNTEIVRLLTKIDFQRFASTGDNSAVDVWDVQDGRHLHTLQGHSRPVTCMCVMNNTDQGTRDLVLLTGASDKLICVWDIEGGTCLFTLTHQDGPVRCLIALSEWNLICAGGENLSLWNNTGTLLHKFKTGNEEDTQKMLVMLSTILVTVVDRQIITYRLLSDQTALAQTWTIQQHKQLPPHREAINSLIQVNDECFASGSLDGTITLWTVPALTPTKNFNFQSEYQDSNNMYPYSIQHMISVQNRYIFAAVGCGFCVFDVTTGHQVAQRLSAHYSKLLHLQFVYNGWFLASCSEDGSVRLWGSEKMLNTEDKEWEEGEDLSIGYMEKFLSKTEDELGKHKGEALQPDLIGECLAHSGAVQMCVDFDGEGFVTCGMDGLLLAWKDGIRQSQRRTEIIRGQMVGENLAGIV